MDAKERILQFFKQEKVDTTRLYVQPIEQYLEHAEELLYEDIPLSGEASHLSAHICNIVVWGAITMTEPCVPIERGFVRLADHGFQLNPKKFHSIYRTFGGLIECKLSIFPSGKLDCMGAINLFSVYASFDTTLSLLRDYVYDGDKTAFQLKGCTISNLVAKCVFDFNVPKAALINLYPDHCSDMQDQPNSCVKHPSSPVFKSAAFQMQLPSGRKCSMSFQENANVNCVGCRNYEDMRYAFVEFYKIASRALRMERSSSIIALQPAVIQAAAAPKQTRKRKKNTDNDDSNKKTKAKRRKVNAKS